MKFSLGDILLIHKYYHIRKKILPREIALEYSTCRISKKKNLNISICFFVYYIYQIY